MKEAAWTVSNITAGNPEQIQYVIDANIFDSIRRVLEEGEFRSQKEAAWVVTNTTTSGTQQQITYLMEQVGILKPFCNLLGSKDARTILVVLTGIKNLFQLADKIGTTDNLCQAIEAIGALDKIEELQSHENQEIYNMTIHLIDTYYKEEEGDAELAPQENGNNFQFNAEPFKTQNDNFQF